ncbi:MAG: DUF1667 domain-containing protein [Oscillospiraceae bacterium]|nr:DUF1667 domain-containing protein [Oscillospiraceae bacterium]
MEKELTCIVCPLGCAIKVVFEKGNITEISGHTCRRGEVYARRELTRPLRMVTCAVPVRGGKLAMGSLKTAKEVPKEKIFEVVRAMRAARPQAPVKVGDVILKNVAGTGVDVISTKAVPALG